MENGRPVPLEWNRASSLGSDITKAMKLSELNEIHASPASWKAGFFYYAPGDPRLVVRKRLASLGWTLNFARPMALPFLLGTVGMFLAGIYGLASADLSNEVKWAVSAGLLMALILAWSWMANPRRYLD